MGRVVVEDGGAIHGHAGTVASFPTPRLHKYSFSTAGSVCVPASARPVGPNYFCSGGWGVLVLGGHEHCFLARATSRVPVLVDALATSGGRHDHWCGSILDCCLLQGNPSLPRPATILSAGLAVSAIVGATDHVGDSVSFVLWVRLHSLSYASQVSVSRREGNTLWPTIAHG